MAGARAPACSGGESGRTALCTEAHVASQNNSAVLEPRREPAVPARVPASKRYAHNRPLMRAAAALRDDVQRTIRDRGWTVLDVAINRAGRAVYLLQNAQGETVPMFRVDVEELVDGRATVAAIVHRNAGSDLAAFGPAVVSA